MPEPEFERGQVVANGQVNGAIVDGVIAVNDPISQAHGQSSSRQALEQRGIFLRETRARFANISSWRSTAERSITSAS